LSRSMADASSGVSGKMVRVMSLIMPRLPSRHAEVKAMMPRSGSAPRALSPAPGMNTLDRMIIGDDNGPPR
jgi:hypothetical protein